MGDALAMHNMIVSGASGGARSSDSDSVTSVFHVSEGLRLQRRFYLVERSRLLCVCCLRFSVVCLSVIG